MMEERQDIIFVNDLGSLACYVTLRTGATVPTKRSRLPEYQAAAGIGTQLKQLYYTKDAIF